MSADAGLPSTDLTCLDPGAGGTSRPELLLPQRAYARIIGHAFDGLPDEACGLLVGPTSGGPIVTRFEPCQNLSLIHI